MSMAKMGLPNMAISACYAGPLLSKKQMSLTLHGLKSTALNDSFLLDMVLGLGISATYNVWVTGETYELELAPTIVVSSIGLMVVLVSAIVISWLNHYKIEKWIGLTWIGIYFITTAFCIFMEIRES